MRSARTAEEDDELPLHAALAAGADRALIQKLLDVDPGGAFVKDEDGDLPLHVALRAWAAPATIEALLRMFPESSAKRDRDGLTPAQLAAHYEDAAEEEAVAALVRDARAEVRRNAEKLRRRGKPEPRAIERVALEAAAGALAATARLVGGVGARAAKAALLPFFPARARANAAGKEDAFGGSEARKSRRRRLFEGEKGEKKGREKEEETREHGGKKEKSRGRERRLSPRRAARRAVFGFLVKSGVAVGAAYGGALVATVAKRDIEARLRLRDRSFIESLASHPPRAQPRERRATFASASVGRAVVATPMADSATDSVGIRVRPEPSRARDDSSARPRKRLDETVPAVLDAVPAVEDAEPPAPAVVALLPEELVRIDTT